MKYSVFGIMFAVLLSAQEAWAEIFKCTDDSGKIGFSDRPCASSQKSEEVKINVAPSQLPAASKTAADYEKERQRKRAEREKLNKDVDDARAKVEKIKSDNYDPVKCSSAREQMAGMKRRDPIGYKLDVSYFEFQQWTSLYCGN